MAEEKPNTRIEYLYRDAGNFKAYGKVGSSAAAFGSRI